MQLRILQLHFGADTGTDHAATLGSRVSITGDNKKYYYFYKR